MKPQYNGSILNMKPCGINGNNHEFNIWIYTQPQTPFNDIKSEFISMNAFSHQVQSPNHLGFVAKLMSCETKALETIWNLQSIKIRFIPLWLWCDSICCLPLLFFIIIMIVFSIVEFFLFNFRIMKLHCHIWPGTMVNFFNHFAYKNHRSFYF